MTVDTAPSYDLAPHVAVPGDHPCHRGWDAIAAVLRDAFAGGHRVCTIDCYSGVFDHDLREQLAQRLECTVLDPASALLPAEEIEAMLAPFDGGDDPLFGLMHHPRLGDYFHREGLERLRAEVEATTGPVLVCGLGATLVHPGDVLVVADMARWEEQQRQRDDAVTAIGVDNRGLSLSRRYKRAYFSDWRACDHHKVPLLERCDFLLDTCRRDDPKLIAGAALHAGLDAACARPFRVVPFFDPAPWGGQWMRQRFGLDDAAVNYGWGFDCVPEENSLLLRVDGVDVEIPALDLVLLRPRELLGDQVHARFGAEFPIRFDFLDTVDGGHLSFQVHPLTEYIQRHFGMAYTQDESYYMLHAEDDACVYLGLRNGVDPQAMARDLEAAERGETDFPVEQHVACWPARRHDHFLIPAGTVHCSGRGGVVLEISATPYIFTFKLWDWGRLGLDGQPRPINRVHGLANVQWERDQDWTRRELINRITQLAAGDGWRCERTGLHHRQFIDTVRHWFTAAAPHATGGIAAGSVHVLNLVQGAQAVIESPDGAFEPVVVNYAETVIVPAAVGRYTVRPAGPACGTQCATIRASVRRMTS